MESVNGGGFKSILAKSSVGFRNTMSPAANKKGVSPAVNRLTKVRPFGEHNTPTKVPKKSLPEPVPEVFNLFLFTVFEVFKLILRSQLVFW